jgi:hypothetical protein
MNSPTEIPQEEIRRRTRRLVAACKTIVRQGEGPHYTGHDAIMELHRALKAAVPGLPARKALERLDA